MKKLTFGATIEIPVDAVDVTELNIRRFYAEETIVGLGKSISEEGQIYPIIVRPGAVPGRYDLVFGSRRLRAAQAFKLEKIEARVADVDDRNAILLALTENLHREDLNAFEEAWAFLKLVNDHKMKLGEIAGRIKRDEPYVRRRIQLLSLPEEVQEFVSHRQLNLAHIDVLARLGTPEDQVQFARSAVRHSLSMDELGTMIRSAFERQRAQRRPKTTKALNGEKVRLRIKGFTDWLENVIPDVLIMGGREIANVKEVIRELEVTAGRAIDQITRKYGKE